MVFTTITGFTCQTGGESSTASRSTGTSAHGTTQYRACGHRHGHSTQAITPLRHTVMMHTCTSLFPPPHRSRSWCVIQSVSAAGPPCYDATEQRSATQYSDTASGKLSGAQSSPCTQWQGSRSLHTGTPVVVGLHNTTSSCQEESILLRVGIRFCMC